MDVITHELAQAVKAALRALNTAPRFTVGDTNSYAIASQCEVALKATEGRTLKALKAALAVIENVTDAMHYEDGQPVTALDGGEIERMYYDLCGVIVETEAAIIAEETRLGLA